MQFIKILPIVLLCFACGNNSSTSDAVSSTLSALTAEELPPPPITQKNVYVLLDGSGSGSKQYAVPKLTMLGVETLIDKISENGGGHLYLNAIDKEANNNAIFHLVVPEIPFKPILREKFVGEQNYQYQKLQKEHTIVLDAFEKSFSKAMQDVAKLIKENNQPCTRYLEQAYTSRSSADDYSDVIGVINSAYRSLQAFPSNAENYVLALSDLENDIPTGSNPKVLNTKPNGVKVLRVNASDSGTKSVETDIEADSFDNALILIFSKSKDK